jgi:large subunit ribosomal protein L29
MKADKVRDLDNAELEKQLTDISEQIYRLRLQILMGQGEGVKKYRVLRKDRARVMTILHERTLAAEAGKG